MRRKRQAGLLLGWRDKRCKQYYCNGEDTHSLVIGATRCGKTRCNVLPTLVLQALAGESMINVDPKGELFGYTKELLERLEYEVIPLDFRDPTRSSRYNFLQPVLDAVLLEDIPLAVERARDITCMLVSDGEHRNTDPIWIDGQRSILMTAILAVCLECQERSCRNLSNARYFLAKMCSPAGEKCPLPLELYLGQLPGDSPLQNALDIARIAPNKMRGSFYTSALTTLELFSDIHIHAMTAATNFDYSMTGSRKRAIFLILPDERGTYYPLASLFVYEQYQALVQAADARGGRLERRVNFNCDEFGNFVRIPDFDKFITVGGGRGIRFNLYVQDTMQIYDKYGDKTGRTIASNCENWIYLQTNNDATLEELSKRLGSYTIKTPNVSGSPNGGSGGYGLTGRRLLMPEEIGRLDRPYQLVSARGGRHAVLYAPDISQTPLNRLLGMGGQEHNRRLLERRLHARPVRPSRVNYWDICDFWIRQARAAAK